LAVPGLRKLGDIDDILAGLAPRPFFESRGDVGEEHEWFNTTHAKAKMKYEELGISERYKTITYQDGHVFSKLMRNISYDWFDKWLSVDE
jgi:hypothetical protein